VNDQRGSFKHSAFSRLFVCPWTGCVVLHGLHLLLVLAETNAFVQPTDRSDLSRLSHRISLLSQGRLSGFLLHVPNIIYLSQAQGVDHLHWIPLDHTIWSLKAVIPLVRARNHV